MKFIRLKILFILILLASSSCKKSDIHPIPNIPVSFSFNINMPEYSPIKAIGNSIIIYQGFYGYKRHGIIIYRSSISDIEVFDATSPEDLNTSVVLSKSMPIATCPTSKKEYILSNGGFSNSGGFPLKQYQGSIAGDIIYISN
ncbi:MAG: hypothetical protein JXA53_04630 [Bacteroidales bacterium]|nr:hypothetical protein [Bacteroidales bacterium]